MGGMGGEGMPDLSALTGGAGGMPDLSALGGAGGFPGAQGGEDEEDDVSTFGLQASIVSN